MEKVQFKQVGPVDKSTKYKIYKSSGEEQYVTAESIWGVLHNKDIDMSNIEKIERKNIFQLHIIPSNELEIMSENPDHSKQDYGSFVTPEQVDGQNSEES